MSRSYRGGRRLWGLISKLGSSLGYYEYTEYMVSTWEEGPAASGPVGIPSPAWAARNNRLFVTTGSSLVGSLRVAEEGWLHHRQKQPPGMVIALDPACPMQQF